MNSSPFVFLIMLGVLSTITSVNFRILQFELIYPSVLDNVARLIELYATQRAVASSKTNAEHEKIMSRVTELERALRDEQFKMDHLKSELRASDAERDSLKRELQTIQEKYQTKNNQKRHHEQFYNDRSPRSPMDGLLKVVNIARTFS